MTHSTEEVAAIAARLTKAQREAIYPGPGNPAYARGKARSTMGVLHRLGLTDRLPSYGGALLTPLGQAVRQHLIEAHP